MSQFMHFANTFLMWDQGPLIWISDVLIGLASIGIIAALIYFKAFKYLWKEWLTTVDHKKIGIMYVIAALLMLFRGGTDALLMRAQLAFPNMHFLTAQHYDEIFTTHGTIMILFMAMPLIIGLMNVSIPLMIGARDVAFPYLNAISFWLFFFGAMLLNISFVFGGSPDGGWTSYPPFTEQLFDPGPGENYYIMSLQLTGIGTIGTGVNFLVTILKMRAPGMKLMDMPIYVWSILITSALILFAFPALTVVLAQLLIDRIAGSHFFTATAGGMPMQFINEFWIWGHPEVYIVILPAFGVFSEVVSTFSSKKIFGYGVMVWSLALICFLSFLVWVHHFFTMGAGAAVNSFFGISTMAIAIPTGIKVFNWLSTMYKGRIRFTLPMLWTAAFIPMFVLGGGVTGVMLAVAPADYQFHNSYFLIAHFHYTLVSGTVFGMLAGLYYWWPKMFGFVLDERRGRWAFWWFVIGFNICFLPQFLLGLMGMTRRLYTYPSGQGWWMPNFISTIGAFAMGIGFCLMVYQIVWSIKYGERDTTGDPWDGRTLEWSMPSPAPEYNFARTPIIKGRDFWWYVKRGKVKEEFVESEIEPIHMPKNSGRPFILSFCLFVAGFGFVFEWYVFVILGFLGTLLIMLWRSFEVNYYHHIPVKEIEETEKASGRL